MTEITLINRETTEGRESIVTKLNLQSYTEIKRAELRVTLHAPDAPDGNGILPIDWRITKITVNGVRFDPSDRLNSVNKIHDSQGGSFFKNILKAGKDNTIAIFWKAPLGAGVISPHAQITAKVNIIGTEIVPGAGQLITTFDPSNIFDKASQTGKNLSLPTALLFLGIIIVLILVAFIILRSGPIVEGGKEITNNVKEIVR